MPSAQEQSQAQALKKAQASNLLNSARNARKKIKATVKTLSLMSYINPFIDWLFGIALILAILKDVLDFINNALIAAGGTGLILITISTFIISLAIGFIIYLTDRTGSGYRKLRATKIAKRKAKKIYGLLSRILLLFGVSLVEIIPAIDLLPLETIAVYFIFILTLKERRINDEIRREEAKIATEMAYAETSPI